MLERYLVGGGVGACAIALTVSLSAQAQSGTASPAAPAASAARPATRATLQGCLVRAQDVPGRSPNVANPAGNSDGYALIHSSSPGAVGTAGSAPPGAVGAAGRDTAARGSSVATEHVGPIYALQGISADTLRTLAGKRVEVNGSLDRTASFDKDADHDREETSQGNANPVGPGSQTQTGTDANAGRGDEKDHWMVFMATSIHEVDGNCPSRTDHQR